MTIKYDKNMVEVVKIKKDTSIVNNEQIRRRFFLDIKLKNKKGTKSVVVIMMNPSNADKVKSDRTVNKVVKYINNNIKTNDCSRVIILNIFVAYKTKPEALGVLIDKTYFDYVAGNKECKVTNDEYIKHVCNKANLIIIAWGKGRIKNYRSRVNEVLDLLPVEMLYCVKDLTKTGYPRHPRNWCYDWDLVKYRQALSGFENREVQ